MSAIYRDLVSGKRTQVKRLVERTFRTINVVDLEESDADNMFTKMYAEILHIKKPKTSTDAAVYRRRVSGASTSSLLPSRYAKVEVHYFRMFYFRTKDDKVMFQMH